MMPPELAHAERRMQQKWCDLVAAEQQGAPLQVLERMYSAYTLAVEEFNRCSTTSQQASKRSQRETPALAHNQKSPTGRRKKAS